jgi:hypothetical protein
MQNTQCKHLITDRIWSAMSSEFKAKKAAKTAPGQMILELPFEHIRKKIVIRFSKMVRLGNKNLDISCKVVSSHSVGFE